MAAQAKTPHRDGGRLCPLGKQMQLLLLDSVLGEVSSLYPVTAITMGNTPCLRGGIITRVGPSGQRGDHPQGAVPPVLWPRI
jgi:hypothetical protein